MRLVKLDHALAVQSIAAIVAPSGSTSWLVEGTAMKSRMHLLATGADAARGAAAPKAKTQVKMNLQKLYAPAQTANGRFARSEPDSDS